jgi:MFS family permease
METPHKDFEELDAEHHGKVHDAMQRAAHQAVDKAERALHLRLSPAAERSIGALLACVVLVGLGEHAGRSFLPLFLLSLGGGDLAIGLLGGSDVLLGALYSFPGGYLSARLGQKRAMRLFNGVAMAGYALVMISPTWWSVVLGASLFLAWSAVSLPASMSLIAHVMPHRRRVLGVALHSMVRRLPMILGPLLGGMLIAHFQATQGLDAGRVLGVRWGFAVALAMALIGELIQDHYMIDAAPEAKPSASLTAVWSIFSGDLKVLLVSDILIRFSEQIPYYFAAVWCVKVWGVSDLQFGVLKAIEMAVALLIYLPVAWMVDKGGKKPYVVVTFAFFALFPLMLWMAHSFWTMVPAFVVRGLKEFGEPARKALIMEMAPSQHESAVFGLYYLLRDCMVSVAAFSAAWLWALSPSTNFITAAVCGFIGLAFFALFGKDAQAAYHSRA